MLTDRPKVYASTKVVEREGKAGLRLEVEAVDDYVRSVAACDSGFTFRLSNSTSVCFAQVVEKIAEEMMEKIDKPNQGTIEVEETTTLPSAPAVTSEIWACLVCTFINPTASNECAMCGSVESTGETDEWSCEMCTFMNANNATSCSMCDTASPRGHGGIVEKPKKLVANSEARVLTKAMVVDALKPEASPWFQGEMSLVIFASETSGIQIIDASFQIKSNITEAITEMMTRWAPALEPTPANIATVVAWIETLALALFSSDNKAPPSKVLRYGARGKFPTAMKFSHAMLNVLLTIATQAQTSSTSLSSEPKAAYLKHLYSMVRKVTHCGPHAGPQPSLAQEAFCADFAIKLACKAMLLCAAEVAVLKLERSEPTDGAIATAIDLCSVRQLPDVTFDEENVVTALDRIATLFPSASSQQKQTIVGDRVLLDVDMALGGLKVLKDYEAPVYTEEYCEAMYEGYGRDRDEDLLGQDGSDVNKLLRRIALERDTKIRMGSKYVRVAQLLADVVLRVVIDGARKLNVATTLVTEQDLHVSWKALGLPAWKQPTRDCEMGDGIRSDLLLTGLALTPGASSFLGKILRFLLEEFLNVSISMSKGSQGRRWSRACSLKIQHLIAGVLGDCKDDPMGRVVHFAILKHSQEATASAPTLLTVLAREGLLEFYLGVLIKCDQSARDAANVIQATVEERKMIFQAFELFAAGAGAGSPEAQDQSQEKGDAEGGASAIATLAADPTAAAATDAPSTSTSTSTSTSPPEETSLFPTDPHGFLKFEGDRRRAFALPTASIPSELLDPFFELYEVYGKDEEFFKHFVPLPPSVEESLLLAGQRKIGAPSCVAPQAEFKANWSKLTRDVFEGVEMANCFFAGGAVLGCVMPSFQSTSLSAFGFGTSDIDVFVCGVTEEEATQRLAMVLAQVCENRSTIATGLGEDNPPPVVVRTTYAVTLLGTPLFRPVQFVLRVYRSPSEVLLGFDVDACTMGLSPDGRVWASPRAWRSLVTRCNCIDLSRRSPSYEKRLEKYALRGFAVHVGHNFSRAVVDVTKLRRNSRYSNTSNGLLRLLYADTDVSKGQRRRRNQAASASGVPGWNKIDFDDDYHGLKTAVRCFDYSSLEAQEVEKLFQNAAASEEAQAVAESLGEELPNPNRVVMRTGHDQFIVFIRFSSVGELLTLLGPLTWMVENPGKQSALLTGSFQPITGAPGDFMQEPWWSKAKAAGHGTSRAGDDAPIALLLCGGYTAFQEEHNYRYWGDDADEGAEQRTQPPLDMSLAGRPALDTCHALEPHLLSLLGDVAPGAQFTADALELVKSLLASFMMRFGRALVNLMCSRVNSCAVYHKKYEHMALTTIKPKDIRSIKAMLSGPADGGSGGEGDEFDDEYEDEY